MPNEPLLSASTPPAPESDASPKLALVVDDSPVQRAHATRLLRDLGWSQIHQAADGQEALNLLAHLPVPPALIVTDLEMPGLDGVDLIEQLGDPARQASLVVTSQREESLLHTVAAMARALGHGRVAALQKPLRLDTLGQALGQCRGTCPAGTRRPCTTSVAPDELAQALAESRVLPHFQPKVDVQTGLLRGVEALARWTDATHGMVPPDVFIPLAEAHGLIGPLTLSILDQALAQAAAWNARGLRLSVAVNLSARLLESPSLAREVLQALGHHRVDPTQLTLEITESCVASQTSVALSTLARLRMKGVGLSIDDYGTGFSSMQQLARIPFTELKVDRSFVDGAHRQHGLQVILQNAIQLASQLNLTTVAEGVERLADWQLLQAAGCRVAQGWLLGKPMPGPDLPGWLRQHQTQVPVLRAPGH